MEDSKTDDGEGELEPGVDEGGVAVVADAHATQSLDPAEGSIEGPAETAQSRTMQAVAVTNGGIDVVSR